MYVGYKMFQEIMEGIGFLTVLSGSMFIGSYFAGSVPMMFSMSEERVPVAPDLANALPLPRN
ncbi:hypothetical protein TELCIR_15806 [Teladorsagia circumcincta]|uniref:Copper transporter n=1 Tax=Teladorsagia circumcincta TaxID=45464 RepID=A0A2G9TXG1_TELCI|nr:hypothetical protein TELCIR_15806 [Teladorsagia circumcincta]